VKRYTVKPCAELGTTDRSRETGKDQTWDVIDLATGRAVANLDTRHAARQEAHDLNSAEQGKPWKVERG
jgi:hypothetical protein